MGSKISEYCSLYQVTLNHTATCTNHSRNRINIWVRDALEGKGSSSFSNSKFGVIAKIKVTGTHPQCQQTIYVISFIFHAIR